MKTGNIFEAIVQSADDELVDLLLQHEKITIQRIVSRGHVSPATGWYDQDHDEWVLLLAGAAVIMFDSGKQRQLEKGDYMNIPAHTRHRVTWTDPETETIWLAIHY